MNKKKRRSIPFVVFFRLKDCYGTFLDRWVNCFDTVKSGVIEGKVSNGNTRLQLVHLGMEQQSVLSI